MRQLTAALLLLVGCTDFYDDGDDPRDAFAPHVCSSYRLTPAGHSVCNDPKGSVAAGYVTEAEIDTAVDTIMENFYLEFPSVRGLTRPIGIHDDYVYWVKQAGSFAAGDTDGVTYVRAALWTRMESAGDPGDCWIKRSPDEYFGTYYTVWRSTQHPLLPALRHEMGHVAFGLGFEH